MENIIENIRAIRTRIAEACTQVGRHPDEVRLLLATKTVIPQNIKLAFAAGETLIGENKVQEIKEKYDDLKSITHEMHFIGHLQTNKIKDIIKYNVDCVQSIDRFDLADKLNHRLLQTGRAMDVLIQVNTSSEESKFGVAPEEAVDLVYSVSQLSNLRIKGLMTIGLFTNNPEQARPCFRLLSDLRSELNRLNFPGVEMKELSMGMSGDLETAIEEGATIVRVGTAIFGLRIYPDSYYWNEGKT